ncbi:MAG: amidase [Proteobacteria bacterium]|nr:amidase [Pseudomonadota bacterium]
MTDPTEVSIADLSGLMESGALRCTDLVAAYRAKIEAEDGDFNAVAFLNPDAEDIAATLDRERAEGRVRGPLHGVPILVKDNIASGDKMMTSAGSLALDGIGAPADSHVVSRLRAAGAVLLGKTNLSEWANFRSTRSSSGWSSRGGQVRNAYATDRTPGGSSSGSGVAAARGFCAAAIGTETDGSVVSPSTVNSIVGIKPTVGMIGRTGIIPISHSQDPAGPMARTVADAAVVLSAIAGPDAADPVTAQAQGGDFTRFLDVTALRGKRIGVVRNYAGFHEAVDVVFAEALDALVEAGATLVDDLSLALREEIRPHELIVMMTEFKVGLNAYLAGLGPETPVRTLADVIAFNEAHAGRTMPYFGQEILLMAEETGGLEDQVYQTALAVSRRLTRENGIDKALRDHQLDALVAPTASAPWAIDLINGDNRGGGGSSSLAAVSGYASITVPMGYVSGLPVGLSFIGGAWSDGPLISLAHAFEQTRQARVPPGPAQRFLP